MSLIGAKNTDQSQFQQFIDNQHTPWKQTHLQILFEPLLFFDLIALPDCLVALYRVSHLRATGLTDAGYFVTGNHWISRIVQHSSRETERSDGANEIGQTSRYYC